MERDFVLIYLLPDFFILQQFIIIKQLIDRAVILKIIGRSDFLFHSKCWK